MNCSVGNRSKFCGVLQSGRNLNSFKNAVRRLDEVALNSRKLERVQALACWLATLQDIQHNLNGEKSTGGTESPRSSHDEDSASSRRASSVRIFLFAGSVE